MSAPWLDEFIRCSEAGGLDLICPIDLQAFHAQAPRSQQLETFGRARPLALVVGNTRALWPRFLAALRTDPTLAEGPDPLDRYVEELIGRALSKVPVRHIVSYGHDRSEPRLPLQRLAQTAGLAELGPAHLSIHPEHGPWIGLRAAVSFDAALVDSASPAPSRCDGCPAPCVAALERALGMSREPRGDGARLAELQFTSAERAWVGVRDACPVGREARYDLLQLHYHYTKDRRTLTRALAEARIPKRRGRASER